MTYTSYNGLARLCVATSLDLKHWTKHGPAFLGVYEDHFAHVWSKSGAIVTSLVRATFMFMLAISSPALGLRVGVDACDLFRVH